MRRMPPLLKGNQSQRMMPRGRQSNNVAEAACVTRMDAPERLVAQWASPFVHLLCQKRLKPGKRPTNPYSRRMN